MESATMLIDRFLGFMPQRSVLWSGVSLFLFILLIQSITIWLQRLFILPWMRAENQEKRKKLYQEMEKK